MEQLITDLNAQQNQGDPEAINAAQRKLQQLQRERRAWQDGLDLLSKGDALLQFYGALTIGLKVRNDWERDQIGEDRKLLAHLLEQLITTFIRISAGPGSDMVVTKMASTLAAIFAQPDSAWSHPCRHVLSCMLAGRYLAEGRSPPVAELLTSATSLPAPSLRALLGLSQALHEEITGTSRTQIGNRGDIQLSNNATDVWQLLEFSLITVGLHAATHSAQISAPGLTIEAYPGVIDQILDKTLQQLSVWSRFAASTGADLQHCKKHFSHSIHLLLHLLEHIEFAQYCIPCITTLQTDHPGVLRNTVPTFFRQVNDSATVRTLLNSLQQGHFSFEATSYADFLEAFVSQLDCMTDEYLKNSDAVLVLERAQSLLRCPGAAMIEDEVCHIVLDIISTITDGYSDWSDASPFDDSMTSLIKDACSAVLVKLQYPLDELDKRTSTWDEDDFTKFEDYRFQAKDFFETAYGILGPSLAQEIVQTRSAQSSWPEFEAVLFVLTALSDALANDAEHCDPVLDKIVSSSYWQQSVSRSVEVPSTVKRAVIRVLAETTSFLQRYPQHMIASLDFLFTSLQIKSQADHAARAIHSLCDNQRSFLVQALPQFLDTIVSLRGVTMYASKKVLGGVAALVQALPREEERIVPLQRLLTLVQSTAELRNGVTEPEEDEFRNPLLERVVMLAAIAKGLQSPADTPIDIENNEVHDATFWVSGPGQPVQDAVLSMLSEAWNVMLQPQQSDLVEAACNFLRAGFKEQQPSPLKFSSERSVQLVCSLIDLNNPNLDQTMNTASCFVASESSPNSGSSPEVDVLFTSVLSITSQATNILSKEDPTSTFTAPTSVLDFISRAFPKCGLHMLTQPTSSTVLTTILDYTTLLLKTTTDTLPRRSAATFFASFLDFTEPTSNYMSNPVAATALTQALDKYSPPILALALHLIAGECARSELESLSTLLRAFVSKQSMRAKHILHEAVKPESGVLTAKALEATRPEQRARFVAQVEGLRGARKTNDVVREFWISCKGGQFGYVT